MSDPVTARRLRAKALLEAMKESNEAWSADKIIRWLQSRYFMRLQTAEAYIGDMVRAGMIKYTKKGYVAK
ncbi:hypothetical protein DRO69_10425 [Candidatus Bathyarchaeota archaeon]|nr:MAG: hypothetical protein DRO69_10425 [Candidatus Bathyarchaeota archaeon]